MSPGIGRNPEILLPGCRLSCTDADEQSAPLVCIKPALLFLDWLHRVDRTSAAFDTGRIANRADDYQLPEWETNEEALQHLTEVSKEMFEEQLKGWYRVPSFWPATRDVKSSLL
jgi:hypothetical protein